MTVEDVDYLTRKLGIKTDLDLRTVRETASATVSPLGAAVNYIHHSSRAYKGIFTPEGMKMMAENIRLFCDRSRYPIYFHCISGADRTGSLAYVLNGFLGVAREDLERDWESSFYPDVPNVVEIIIQVEVMQIGGAGDPAHGNGLENKPGSPIGVKEIIRIRRETSLR